LETSIRDLLTDLINKGVVATFVLGIQSCEAAARIGMVANDFVEEANAVAPGVPALRLKPSP
jgi:Na+/serine symporter